MSLKILQVSPEKTLEIRHKVMWPDKSIDYVYTIQNPEGRPAIFVGDLVDSGPASNLVLRLVMSMVKNEQAFCVLGNHDDKLKRKLYGKNVQIKHGLQETLDQLATEPETFIEEVKTFLSGLITHYIFDDGKLCVAHAGLREDMQGRTSGAAPRWCCCRGAAAARRGCPWC